MLPAPLQAGVSGGGSDAGAVYSDRLFAAAGDPADHRQRYDAAGHGRDPLIRPAAGAAGPGESGHRPAADPHFRRRT